jgi:tetratricopeptide (TPR) repeat protein
MRTISLIIILSACCFARTEAQIIPDSLSVESQADKAFSLLESARKVLRSNPEAAVDNIEDALQIAYELDDKRIEAFCYSTLGSLQFGLKNYSRSAEYYAQAIGLFKEVKDAKSAHSATWSLAAAHELGGKYDKALQAYSVFLTRATELTNSADMVRTMTAIARINQIQKKLPIALDWYKKALRIEEDRKNAKGIIEIRNYMGLLYQEMGETALALESFRIAGEMARETNDAGNLSQSYESLGQFYKSQKDLAKELEVLRDAIQVNRDAGNTAMVRDNALRIGQILVETGEYAEAIEFLEEVSRLSHGPKNIEQYMDAQKLLGQVYEALGQNEKAYNIFKGLTAISDSINKALGMELTDNNRQNDDFQRKLSEIRYLKYIYKEKTDSLSSIRSEKELMELKLERERQESRMRQTVIYGLLGMLAILAVSIFVVITNIRAKRKANRLLALQHLRTQMNPHFIFNSLNSINSFIARNDERSANKYLSEFSRLMRAVLENSKHEFVSMSSELDILKLYLDLEHLRFSDKFEYTFEFDPELMSEEIMIPPMLVQPYIENSIWHGLRYKDDKGHLKVSFRKKNDYILCVVEDDGIGRKKSAELKTRNQQEKRQSTALKNIDERLRIINEVHHLDLKVRIVDIDENGRTGTRVEVMIPYISNELAA